MESVIKAMHSAIRDFDEDKKRDVTDPDLRVDSTGQEVEGTNQTVFVSHKDGAKWWCLLHQGGKRMNDVYVSAHKSKFEWRCRNVLAKVMNNKPSEISFTSLKRKKMFEASKKRT